MALSLNSLGTSLHPIPYQWPTQKPRRNKCILNKRMKQWTNKETERVEGGGNKTERWSCSKPSLQSFRCPWDLNVLDTCASCQAHTGCTNYEKRAERKGEQEIRMRDAERVPMMLSPSFQALPEVWFLWAVSTPSSEILFSTSASLNWFLLHSIKKFNQYTFSEINCEQGMCA